MTIRIRLSRHLPIAIAALLMGSFVVARITAGQLVMTADKQAIVIYPLFIYGHNFDLFLGVVLVATLLVAVWVVKTKVYWVGLVALAIAPTAVCMMCYTLTDVQPIQSLQIEDSNYYLAKIEEVDFDFGRVTFIVYRCDQSGIYCAPEHVTDLGTAQEGEAKLTFNDHFNQLFLERNGKIVYVVDKVASSTPIPIQLVNLAPITPENSDKLAQIARLVRGPIANPMWFSDSKTLALVRRPWRYDDVTGIWFYDATAFEKPPRLWIPQGFNNRTDQLVAFSPNNKHMAAVIDGHISVWDILTDKRHINWRVPEDRYANNMVFHPNNTIIAYSTYVHTPGGIEIVVGLFDLQRLTSRTLYKQLGDSENIVNDLAFSPDGKYLAIASSQLSLWEISSGAERILQPSKTATNGLLDYATRVHTFAFSHDSAFLASANNDGTAFIWDVTTGRPIFPLSERDGSWVNVQVRSLAFSPVNQLVAGVDSDGSLHLWDISTRKLLSSQQDCKKFPGEVIFNSGGTVITMTSEEGVICIWGIQSSN